MNDDDVRSILSRSLDEGGMRAGDGPEEAAIARRVRGVRRRRTAGTAIGAVASVALVAVIAWQAGAFDRDPAPPATPTQTSTGDPTEDPTGDEPTGEEPSTDPTGEEPDPASWSDAVFPECGDVDFALPERQSQLVVDGGPSGSLPPGAWWPTVIRNTGSTTVGGHAGILQTVVVDGDGAVVATVDPDDPVFWGAEGGVELSVAAGEEMPFAVQGTFGCDGAPLPAGSYTAYVLITVDPSGEADRDALQQAQGGPFPFTVDDGAAVPDLGLTAPEGAVEWSTGCGDAWSMPQVETGYQLELLDSIRAERPAGDDINGRSRLTTTSTLTGSLRNEVVLVADGQVVGEAPGTDALPMVFLSGGSTYDDSFVSQLMGCDGQPLPPGDYQAAVMTVLYIPVPGDMERYVVAAAEPVDLLLR